MADTTSSASAAKEFRNVLPGVSEYWICSHKTADDFFSSNRVLSNTVISAVEQNCVFFNCHSGFLKFHSEITRGSKSCMYSDSNTQWLIFTDPTGKGCYRLQIDDSKISEQLSAVLELALGVTHIVTTLRSQHVLCKNQRLIRIDLKDFTSAVIIYEHPPYLSDNEVTTSKKTLGLDSLTSDCLSTDDHVYVDGHPIELPKHPGFKTIMKIGETLFCTIEVFKTNSSSSSTTSKHSTDAIPSTPTSGGDIGTSDKKSTPIVNLPKRNIEVKIQIDAKLRSRIIGVLARSNLELITLNQTDIYFDHIVNGGRLKLRIETENAENGLVLLQRNTLIYYRRIEDSKNLTKDSSFILVDCGSINKDKSSSGHPLLSVLASSLGIRRRVVKTRNVAILKNTRIHVDEVENLGSFVELEYVVNANAGYPAHEGEPFIERVLSEMFEISKLERIQCSYEDLLEQKTASSSETTNTSEDKISRLYCLPSRVMIRNLPSQTH